VPRDLRDLFVEDRESVSIRWALGGSAVVQYGRRTGSGTRQGDRSGGTLFFASDGLSPGKEPGPQFVPWPTDDGWVESETRRATAYVEAACRGVLTEAAARSIEAEIHIFRQRIRHETPSHATGDARSGIRVVLRAVLEGSPPVHRRLADRSADRLFHRRPPEKTGVELGTSLLVRREGSARVDGLFPAILGSGGCGALAHEIGHVLEGDHSRLGHSRLLPSGRRVARSDVTLVDDPRACDGRGSYEVDDEGAPPRRVVLIEQGVVKDTLTRSQTREAAAGEDRGGHGRRGSYRDLPLPRMACTFLAAGSESPESVLSDTPRGVYLASLRSGDVDPVSGALTLIIEEGFLIENGRLTRPLGDGVLLGGAAELLESLDAVCDDLELDHGAGDCAKSDQAVPVTVGMPTVRARMVRILTT